MFENYEENASPVSAAQGVTIHPSAVIAVGAEFGRDVQIGPNAVIGPRVKLGDGVKVGAGVVIEGRTSVGENTRIHSFATLGSDPQDLKYSGEKTELIIGKENQIREYVNISVGTVGGGGVTRIGDHNLLMVYSHVAHDCQIGNHCIFANSVQLAGHIVVEDQVVFGGMAGGHQFCQFGRLSMIAAGSVVVQDVPPYCLVQGDRAKINGLNLVGLRRAGYRGDSMKNVKSMFKTLFQEFLTVEDACAKIESSITDNQDRNQFLEFLKQSERGICR